MTDPRDTLKRAAATVENGISIDAQQRQMIDLLFHNGMKISSCIESRVQPHNNDIEHRFQMSDGDTTLGVVVLITALRGGLRSIVAQQERGGTDARDAARYRWLRAHCAYRGTRIEFGRGFNQTMPEGLDASIDAAMKEQP